MRKTTRYDAAPGARAAEAPTPAGDPAAERTLARPTQAAAEDGAARLGALPPGRRVALGASGLRTFFRIADAWELSGADQQALLGDVSRSALHAWRRQAPETPDVYRTDLLMRLSLLLGIYGMLQRLYGESPTFADGWVAGVNRRPIFRGRSPLALMAAEGIPGLLAVRRLLEAEAGGSLADADDMSWDGALVRSGALAGAH